MQLINSGAKDVFVLRGGWVRIIFSKLFIVVNYYYYDVKSMSTMYTVLLRFRGLEQETLISWYVF